MCSGFLRSFDGTNQGVSSLLTSSFKERTGILLLSVIGRSRQDAAAKGKCFSSLCYFFRYMCCCACFFVLLGCFYCFAVVVDYTVVATAFVSNFDVR